MEPPPTIAVTSELRRLAGPAVVGFVAVFMLLLLAAMLGFRPGGSGDSETPVATELSSGTGDEGDGGGTDVTEVDESITGAELAETDDPVFEAEPSPGTPSEERVAAALYYNDFSEPLGWEWDQYYSPGHAGWGLRRPSAITVEEQHPDAESGGVLAITATMGTEGDQAGLLVSGGAKLIMPQTFGRYTFRLRVDSDPSEVTSGVALLWPQSLQWPEDGEVDIVETWGDRVARSPVESNIHHLAADATEPYEFTDDRLIPFLWPDVDGTEWNVYHLDWRSDLLAIAINGGEPVTLTDDPAVIPQWNMELAFQLDAFDSPDRPGLQPVLDDPVRLEVDWVLVEAAFTAP